MNIKTLRKFDLNALVTLQVLLEEKHVTQTAEKLNLTQSAVSRTLAKLRQMFDDPLLVKSGKHLALTTKAERLQPQLNKLLEGVSELLIPDAFDPATYQGSIRLATTDYGSHSILPRLVPLLNKAAPNVQLSALDWRSNLLTELEDNKVDLIIGGATEPPADIFQRVVAHDHFQVLVRRGHPHEHYISLEDYLQQDHAMISPTGSGNSDIDELLAKQGMARKIAVRVPHFFAALEIIARTDFMILLPANFIRRYVDLDRFSVLDAPFQIPAIDISMFWHARMHHDPLHKWFRGFVYQTIYSHPKRIIQSE
ncbi:LysR family transcriptional regulator [Oceanospirillum beijerinckii]|uniref:LysR family transcriptional regulator n=1 Tax=Oceanospirillum beijerinckii TaxID=64976 RepID=UPI00041A93BD|nr:LysR family transcriptional regulator [Oceanospirillum beijerinckii]MAC46559.1 LysR family transcriptional regulator [Oceanospirillum sp.]